MQKQAPSIGRVLVMVLFALSFHDRREAAKA